MNRQVTGLLAWGALALVVAVPSADVMFSGSGKAVTANSVAPADDGVDTRKPFFGPMPAQATAIDKAPAGAAELTGARDTAAVPTDKIQPATEPDDTLQTAEIAPDDGGSALPTDSPAPVSPERQVGRNGVRIVGGQDLSALDTRVPGDPGTGVTIQPQAELPHMPTQGVPTAKAAPGTEPGSGETSVAVAPDGAASGTTPAVGMDAADVSHSTEVANADLRNDITTLDGATPGTVAKTVPYPMPASMRPDGRIAYASRTYAAASTAPGFESDVRQSIANIRARNGSAAPIPPQENYDLGDGDVVIWGDNPRYRGSGTILEPYELDQFRSETYAADRGVDDGYAGDSLYYQLWLDQQTPGFRRSGSFSDQYPAQHGGGVRLDLLQ